MSSFRGVLDGNRDLWLGHGFRQTRAFLACSVVAVASTIVDAVASVAEDDSAEVHFDFLENQILQ